MVDKNEKYDKSCKNAMNVVLSKKSLKRFMIQFVKKKLLSGSKSSVADKYRNVTSEPKTKRNQSFCMEDPVIGNHMNK